MHEQVTRELISRTGTFNLLSYSPWGWGAGKNLSGGKRSLSTFYCVFNIKKGVESSSPAHKIYCSRTVFFFYEKSTICLF